MNLLGKVWKVMPRGARQVVSRSVQTKFTVSAAGVILNDAGEVLLLDHVLRPDSGWGVPGGFMDAGEQPEAAFRREIMEETGIEVRDVSLHRVRTLTRHIEVIFLAKAVGEPEVLSPEIRSLGWFAPDKLPPAMSLDQQFLITKALGLDG
ncbi:MAG: NUDIX hydrolase [Pyrinomonadaceae bacterium]